MLAIYNKVVDVNGNISGKYLFSSADSHNKWRNTIKINGIDINHSKLPITLRISMPTYTTVRIRSMAMEQNNLKAQWCLIMFKKSYYKCKKSQNVYIGN